MSVREILAAGLILTLGAPGEARPLPIVREGEDLGRYGSVVPAWLQADGQFGIRHCFLARRTRDDLDRLGLRLIRCTRERAVAVARDRIGLPAAADADRQPLAVSIVAPGPLPYPLAGIHLERSGQIAADVEALVRRRFEIAPSRTGLSYSAIVVDPGLRPFGSVTVSAGPANICEFSFFEMRYPQTSCFISFHDFLVVVNTNATNYEAIQEFIASLTSVVWVRA